MATPVFFSVSWHIEAFVLPETSGSFEHGIMGDALKLTSKLLRHTKGDACREPGNSTLFLFSRYVMDKMGNTPPIPSGSPLECILRNWKNFDPENIKKKGLIFICNMAWPQHKLGDEEVWR